MSPDAERAAQCEIARMATAEIKAIMGDGPVSPEKLEKAEEVLADLATSTPVFSSEIFPLPADSSKEGVLYNICQETDGSYSLYLSVQRGGLSDQVDRRPAHPHQHNVWAVAAGVTGTETNRIYDRVDGGEGPGPSELRQVREILIAPGTTLSMMPDGIHSAHPAGDDPSRILLLYAQPLGEVLLFSKDGTSCETFTVPNIA